MSGWWRSCGERTRNLANPAGSAIQRQGDPFRRGRRRGIDTNHWQTQNRVLRWCGQAIGSPSQIDDQNETSLLTKWQADNAKSADFEQAAEFRRARGDTAGDVDLIIRNQFEAPGQKP
jgi:hypothetical protein